MRHRYNNRRNQEVTKGEIISMKLCKFAELLEKPRSPGGVKPFRHGSATHNLHTTVIYECVTLKTKF